MNNLFLDTFLALVLTFGLAAQGQDTSIDRSSASAQSANEPTPAQATSARPAGGSGKHNHAALLRDATEIDGLLRLYRSRDHLYAELHDADYAHEYIVLISLARGIGQDPLLGGMSWGFGDDWVWAFRKIENRVHVLRKNVRFRADKDSPEASAVRNAYTDSVLFSLPIVTKGPHNGDLIDLTSVFMSDLPQISQVLRGFTFSDDKSTWDAIKGFSHNVEIEVAATYASSGQMAFDSVPDSRGVTINVHYSISRVPRNNYQPRLADDRIGYFLTVVKDYSKNSERDRFVRYINRWHLEKADEDAATSPPQQPLIFWIEKTVPFPYRKPIRDGIAEWNKAFQQAGFIDAIEVRQQPDDADWDPEDVNYNTFRWITANAGFALGPSRVNPYTGQILDADILFDADFLDSWKSSFETFTPLTVSAMTGGTIDLAGYQDAQRNQPPWCSRNHTCRLDHGMAAQLAFGRTVLMSAMSAPQQRAQQQERMIMQGLKCITMHEVGHTLGLRHNFKASTLLALDDLHNTEKTSETGLSASVMDYLPVNIAAPNSPQGDYYSSTIGPYDYWAIEYGYRPLAGNTDAELPRLQEIARRSGEPCHCFATDEDARGIDPDPLASAFDLGHDPLAYAAQQASLVAQLLPGLVDRITQDGEDYSQARRAFNVLLATHGRAVFFAARFIGGLDVSRSHRGDPQSQSPFAVIDAEQQRAALRILQEHLFSGTPYQVDPEVYNRLAPLRFEHWGIETPLRTDFPVHEIAEMWQSRVLDQLLSPLTLQRLHDNELKVAADQDAFTAAELIETLTGFVFEDLEHLGNGSFTNRQPAINSLRRNLQRNYLQRLGNLAMGRTSAPEDCQAIAYAELSTLLNRIRAVQDTPGLDSYTRAHLRTTADRTQKVLEASLVLYSP